MFLLVLAVFALLFGLGGAISVRWPGRTADYLRSRGIPIRIGGVVAPTNGNVRFIGIAFIAIALGCVALIVWLAVDPAAAPHI